MGSLKTAKRKQARQRQAQRPNCERKRSYGTRNEARIAAERAGGYLKKRMSFYRCVVCKDFHLTAKTEVNNV